MHICFITSEFPKKNFPHGGAGTFIATIAKELIKNGICVSVVGINYIEKNELENIDGIEVHRISTRKIKGLQWWINSKGIYNKIKEINAKKSIDIIESAELGLAFLPKIKTIKYIIRLHGGHHFFAEGEKRSINWWKGFQEKKSFKKADAFIAVSEYVKIHTQKYLSYNNKPLDLINYPISFDKFKPDYQVVPDNNKIVFAGTVCEKKGIRQLIASLSFIKQKFPDVYLDVYGRDWFFPNGISYVDFLKDEFSSEQLKNVNFKGMVNHDQLPSIYQSAVVCAFPSHIETQGLVVPEAMAMEKCVLFSETGPGPETIIPFKTGLLCNPHEPEDIANKIIWILEHPEKVKIIAKEARIAAIRKFDLDTIVQKNIRFYKDIIQL